MAAECDVWLPRTGIRGEAMTEQLGVATQEQCWESCDATLDGCNAVSYLSLIHISEPTRPY